jgi:rubredoxin
MPTETYLYSLYVCLECGWIYDETLGMPERGIPPGTRWEELPGDFTCGDCEIQKRDTHMWQRLPA